MDKDGKKKEDFQKRSGTEKERFEDWPEFSVPPYSCFPVSLLPYFQYYRKINNLSQKIVQKYASYLREIESFPEGLFWEWIQGAKKVSLVVLNQERQEIERVEYRQINNSPFFEGNLWVLSREDFQKTCQEWQQYRIEIITFEDVLSRIPSKCSYAVQNLDCPFFNACSFTSKHKWKCGRRKNPPKTLRIYEAHIGIANNDKGIGSYREFEEKTLPRIVAQGFNAIQLMGIPEHSYYASFGYQTTNLFAPSSRFGTPDDLRHLIDSCHNSNIWVILDICLSHASSNKLDGLANFDGKSDSYFYSGEAGWQTQWGCKVYDLTSPQVQTYLLSAVGAWIEDFRVDGFRCDAVTSMIYKHHGLRDYSGRYLEFFNSDLDLVKKANSGCFGFFKGSYSLGKA